MTTRTALSELPTSIAVDRRPLKARLQAAHSSALDWVDRHLACFDPREPTWLFDEQRAKQFTELAVIAGLCVEYGSPPTDPRLSRVGELVVAVSRRPELRHRVVRFPAELILFLDVYSSASRFGYRDAELFELMHRVVDKGLFRNAGRTPHQELELRLALESVGLPTPVRTRAAIARESLLTVTPCPLYLADPAVYELTHILMFHEGYGIRRPEQPVNSDVASLRTLLAHLIVMKCRESHWDLLAELLYCWDCLWLPPTRVTRAAWLALLNDQQPCGEFPFRANASSSTSDIPCAGPAPFRDVYHTTLVVILACALKLRRLEVAL